MRPTLIHKVMLKLRNVNTDTTVKNKIWDEVEGDVKYEESITIFGQVKFYTLEELKAFADGFQMTGDGYINVYPEDGEKIKDGAKLVQIGRRTVEFYIKDNTQFAHYEDAELMRFSFESKNKGTV